MVTSLEPIVAQVKSSPANIIQSGQLAVAPYGRGTFTGTIAQIDPIDHWGDVWVRLVDDWRTHWVLSVSIIQVYGKAA